MENWLQSNRWMQVLLILLIGFFLASCGFQVPQVQVLQANYAFLQGDYLQSTIGYIPLLNDPTYFPFVAYNLGNVYYALGEFGPALELWRHAEDSPNLELLFRTKFNQGVLFFEQRNFDQARRAFIQALELNPSSVEAKINLELSLERLDLTVQSQPPRITTQRDDSAQIENDPQTLRIFDYLRRKEGQLWTPAQLNEDSEVILDW
jgi:tetratricopeptide (TPR) repeat protein